MCIPQGDSLIREAKYCTDVRGLGEGGGREGEREMLATTCTCACTDLMYMYRSQLVQKYNP